MNTGQLALRPVFLCQRPDGQVERRSGLIKRDAARQSSDCDHPLHTAVRQSLGRDRWLHGSPQLRSLGIAKVARHHADNRVRVVVERHRPPDNVRIAAVERLPHAVTDHDDARRSGVVIVGGQRAAEDRRASQHVEERVRHGANLELSRITHASQRRREVDRRHRGDRLEGARARGPVARVEVGNFNERMIADDVGLPEDGDAALLAKGVGAEEHRLDYAVERRRRANAERQRRDDQRAQRRPDKRQSEQVAGNSHRRVQVEDE